MQEIIRHIFEKLDGYKSIADGTGLPVQTVHAWLGTDGKKPAEIPPWRRPAILELAQRTKRIDELSEEARAYLTSTDRTVRKAAA